MSSSSDLLRMLEPAVRPVAVPGGATRPPQKPLESRDFDDLLADARVDGGPGAEGSGLKRVFDTFSGAVEVARKPDPLGPLSDVDAINNASLRRLRGGDGTVDLRTNTGS